MMRVMGRMRRRFFFLFEIERDIARLEDGEGLDDGRGEERTGGMDFKQKKSHAGGRARPDARGHRGSSEIPNRSNTQAAAASQAGRHLDGSGHARRHQTMTEDDIAPPTRDFPRLGVRSREHGKTPRPPRHQDLEDLHADEAPNYHQPRESLISGRHHQPSAGHGRSSSGHFADHESRAPSRHQNVEDYATAESVYQSRGSCHGSHLPPTSGHGRPSGRFADLYSSR